MFTFFVPALLASPLPFSLPGWTGLERKVEVEVGVGWGEGGWKKERKCSLQTETVVAGSGTAAVTHSHRDSLAAVLCCATEGCKWKGGKKKMLRVVLLQVTTFTHGQRGPPVELSI